MSRVPTSPAFPGARSLAWIVGILGLVVLADACMRFVWAMRGEDALVEFKLGVLGLATAAVLFVLYRSMVRQRTSKTLQDAESVVGELVALRAAMDKHTLFSITDASGKIVDVNEGFCRISGYTREELLGQDHRLLNSGHHPKSFWVGMWKTLASGEAWRADVCNRAKDGSLYWVDSTNIPQFNAEGKVERFISLRFDITQQKLMQERLDLASSAAHFGIWDWNIETGHVYYNESYCENLGYTIDEVRPHVSMWEESLHEDDIADARADVEAHFAGRTGTYINEHRMKHKDGSWRWFRACGEIAERAEDGTPKRMIGLSIDIQHLREAIEEAQEASRSKSEFLANMSHEIRTPMTAILGYADLLGGDLAGDPEGAADAITTIQSNASHLLTIINDILDVSKIEAGQLSVEIIEMDPVRIVEEVKTLIEPRVSGKGIDLRVRFDTEMPEVIQSDPTRLRQVLLNLMGNAVKFTEMGSVEIHVSCDPDSWLMKFDVVDTGLGMTPEQCEKISQFQAFSQADSSTTRKFGGTGLGLRISNGLAIMLGGGISIESEYGKGSTFTVTIGTGDLDGVRMLSPDEIRSASKSQDDTPKHFSSPATLSVKPLQGLRVLLAEDGPDNQRLISFHLKKAGAEVTVCENGLIAAETIENASEDEMPHVVFMDMAMPVLDGYSATSRLRAGGCELPIIALTAHAMDGDRQKCLDAGCTDYTTKPIDRAKLIGMAAEYGHGDSQSRRAA